LEPAADIRPPFLAELADGVYTVERIEPLLEKSKELLQSLGTKTFTSKPTTAL